MTRGSILEYIEAIRGWYLGFSGKGKAGKACFPISALAGR
jgi:hypothetical protein